MDQKPVLYSLGVASAIGITTKNAVLTVATLVGAYYYFNMMDKKDSRYATNSDLSIHSTTMDPYKPDYTPPVFPINHPNHTIRDLNPLLAIR
jgi:hypothetical protein